MGLEAQDEGLEAQDEGWTLATLYTSGSNYAGWVGRYPTVEAGIQSLRPPVNGARVNGVPHSGSAHPAPPQGC